jgi:putative transposase
MDYEHSSYPRHRFPAEVISHGVWLCHVFSLSLRDVELIVAERGVVATHERIRRCWLKLGADFVRRLRRRRPQPGETWHLDEVFIHIRGVLHYLSRAADQRGVVLDILMQDRRSGADAKCFFKHLLHGMRSSRVAPRHRWPAQLRRCSACGYARCPASDKQVPQQPS